MDYNEVVTLINDYEQETRSMKRLCFKLAWHMRGGMTMEEMYNTSFNDRQIIAELIEENMQTTKDSGLPYF